MSDMLRTEWDDDDLLTVVFDQPGKSVNTLTGAALEALDAAIDTVAKRRCRGVIFTSAKLGVFISGADLVELAQLQQGQIEVLLQRGQRVFERIEQLAVPTVALINGHCLGGGLELALACRWRVVADIGSINIGLPEIKLGIIPGWGGTTRLSRRLGLTAALPLLLGGKMLSPRKAERAGIIDQVVRPEVLPAAARRLLETASARSDRRSAFNRLVAAVGPLTAVVCRAARRQALARTYGNYPAAEVVIDVARTAVSRGHEAGLAAERRGLVQLAGTETAQNLMRLFFLRQNTNRALAAQVDSTAKPTRLVQVGVIGGGTMGAGIVHALVRSGLAVRLVDVSETALAAGLGRVRKLLADDCRAARLSRLEADEAMHRIAPATGLDAEGPDHRVGLQRAGMVIEAVAEDLDVKRKVFGQLDRLAGPQTILATNTSSLAVGALAEATSRPDRVIGLHFFNPVPQMVLVEVIRTTSSTPEALQAGVQLAQRLGKTPILVGDGPGFLVNRILIPYLAEAMQLACQGIDIMVTDRAMKRWGMPMGPFELLDQVGLDIAMHVVGSLRDRLDEHIVTPDRVEQAVEHGWLGRKSHRGFYEYGQGGKLGRVNHQLVGMLSRSTAQMTAAQIQRRLVLPMVNEAARLLIERITDSTDTIDLATVLGLGLAPFRGGLIHFAETTGLKQIVYQMDELAEQVDRRFLPVAQLRQLAEAGLPMQDLAEPEKASLAADSVGKVAAGS